MQPDQNRLALIRRIAGKEITLFFASPIAYLFLATFAAVTLFIFFWGSAFFARNIADVRPMFEWMPILLIFLASTLTMRLWSEERRTGTLEHVLTQPVPLWYFVVGKFIGCLGLLAIALAITLPLPITVSMIGDLDWGPVWAGYLATFLLGAAYLSIGLFVSARSDNQIVSLISATALCTVFYLLGSNTLTEFFGTQASEWLRLLGTGSRFESITRGVIDLRDLYYYVSIMIVFLSLNTFMLEKERWATSGRPGHRTWRRITALLLANAIGANLWLGQIDTVRADTTKGGLYSISSATRHYLDQLQEPLLLRGYFSSKTHPLLAPLVPQLKDLMKEYGIAGHGKVRVEFVDPETQPAMEKEANQKYGIKPVPFKVASRYQSSIVSSYFNVLVKYGDQFKVLNFRDLIEVKAGGEHNLKVDLRNPEHDLTRAIKKVMEQYRTGGNLFNTIQGNVALNAYISADDKLPKQLVDFRKALTKTANDLKAKSNGRFTFSIQDPDANGGKVAQKIQQDYGFQPMSAGLFGGQQFYFYLTMAHNGKVVQIPIGDMKAGTLKRNLKAGLQHFAKGFTKTVALVTPPDMSRYAQYGMPQGPQFNRLRQFLGSDLNVEPENLSDGHVSGNADILLLMAPKDLSKKALFAVDQFLMQGGTVIVATSPYSADISRNGLSLKPQQSGLEKWLAHNGLKIQKKLVLDPQNAAFPIPVERNVGGLKLQELKMLDYPYFPDLRGQGLNEHNPITQDLPQLTMAWASPIQVEKKQDGRKITKLLQSSPGSWTSDSLDVMPRLKQNGVSSFPTEGKTGPQLMGVIDSGHFKSYFAGKPSPLLADAKSDKSAKSDKKDKAKKPEPISGVIDRSPASSRIILFSSNDFLRDQIIQLAGSSSGSQYLNSMQMMANTIDWSLEDPGLLSIRSRGHFNRTLPPMQHSAQLFWEYLNYLLAALALGLVAFIQRRRRKSREQAYAQILAK